MRKGRFIAAAAAATFLAAGCSSSKPSGSGSGNSVTIGVITDLTGPAASGNKTFVQGVDAGVILAKRDGYTVKTVVGDTQTSPAQALAVAQKLVSQDHVEAVLVQSALAFSAASYLTQQGIPVIGVAEDAGEWATDKNMFPIAGALHTTVVTTTLGQILKLLSATTVGTLGYGISPSSANSAKAGTKSVQAAGLKSGYENANFPFGSTNVQPVAIAMKSAGVDAFYASVDPNTSFSLITGLRQAGVALKAAVLPDGYGADTLQAGPGALQAAQNVYFTLGYEPVAMNTPATQQLQSDLAAGGTTGVPTYGEYNGYVSVGLLVEALKGAGSHPTHQSIITSLSHITAWNALGLWGGRTVNINDRENLGAPQLCSWVTKLVGIDFQLVSGADPLCGTVIPGVTVG